MFLLLKKNYLLFNEYNVLLIFINLFNYNDLNIFQILLYEF